MTSRELVAPRVLATGLASIATATTTAFDFGTPDDIKVAAGANYKPGDRLVFVITADTAGTTDSNDFIVLDAPDSSGSIGSTAAAVTTTIPAGAAGAQYVCIGVRLQPGRPWQRLHVHRASGTTDTVKCRALLLAVPHNL
jgi:hypothetical protein